MKVVVTLTEEVERALQKKARQQFGVRKGATSLFIEMVLRKELHLNMPNSEVKTNDR